MADIETKDEITMIITVTGTNSVTKLVSAHANMRY